MTSYSIALPLHEVVQLSSLKNNTKAVRTTFFSQCTYSK